MVRVHDVAGRRAALLDVLERTLDGMRCVARRAGGPAVSGMRRPEAGAA